MASNDLFPLRLSVDFSKFTSFPTYSSARFDGMPARITKFTFGPWPLDTKDRGVIDQYVQDTEIDIRNQDDLKLLEGLDVRGEQQDARIIYLVELAAGPKRLFRTASLGFTVDEEASQSAKKLPFEENLPIWLAEFFKNSLGVPQTLFKDHGAHGPKFRFSEEFTSPSAPTTLRADESFALRYYELISYTGDPSTLCHLSELDDVELTCASTGRQIQFHQWQGCRRKEGMLLIVQHKCSFWVRKTSENGYTGTNTLSFGRPLTSIFRLTSNFNY